jgi:hypothetical protein
MALREVHASLRDEGLVTVLHGSAGRLVQALEPVWLALPPALRVDALSVLLPPGEGEAPIPDIISAMDWSRALVAMVRAISDV